MRVLNAERKSSEAASKILFTMKQTSLGVESKSRFHSQTLLSRRSKRKMFLLIVLWITLAIKLSSVKAILYKPEETDDLDDPTEPEPSETGAQNKPPPPASCNMTKTLKTSDSVFEICLDKKKLFLTFDPFDDNDLYPTWTYRGFNGPTEWHKIDPQLFNTDSKYSGSSLKEKYPKTDEARSSGVGTKPPSDPQIPGTEGAQKEPTEYYSFVPSFMRFNGHLPDNFCDGPMPSPIEIETEKAKLKDSLTEFEYTHMDETYAIQMYFPEDGTNILTVRALDAWEMSKAPCISKGSVTGPDLCLDRFIIHYGTDGKTGSEHRLGNRTFGMEFQFFFTHQKVKKRTAAEFYYVYLNDYLHESDLPSSGEVQKWKGKLVRALAVFVEVVDDIESDPNMHILAELAKQFWASTNQKKIRSIKTKERIFTFQPFFPTSVYYTYKGSLTFPPCFPDLDWTVFEKPIQISRKDFESFLFIPSEFDETGYVAGNFRPIESIYVQLEDPSVNRDEQERKQAEEARKNREVFKSLAPHDTSKEALYDYYDSISDSAEKLLPSAVTAFFEIIIYCLICIVIY